MSINFVIIYNKSFIIFYLTHSLRFPLFDKYYQNDSFLVPGIKPYQGIKVSTDTNRINIQLI